MGIAACRYVLVPGEPIYRIRMFCGYVKFLIM